MVRPEHQAPPEVFYGEAEAQKYATNSRMFAVQTKMTERALQLLLLPPGPKLLLDIGCGSGISGELLTEAGHAWVGFDISPAMLAVARARDAAGDLLCADAGRGARFRPGAFDGAVSVSALQWLCNCDRRGQEPYKRLRAFFDGLFTCLRRGARAALQFYPESAAQTEMITSAALRAGFSGGLVVDFPHSTRAKKCFLVVTAGGGGSGSGCRAAVPAQALPGPRARAEGQPERTEVSNEKAERRALKKKKKAGRGSKPSRREWVLKKKACQRKKGRVVGKDTKYTARKRKPRL